MACDRDYRVVVLRKRLATEKGADCGLFEEYRYFFFITNDREMPADQVVLTAKGRCDQENLIAQLKGGVHALTHAGGQPGEQLGVHGHGEPGVEPEGVGGVAGARDAPARRGAPAEKRTLLRMEFRTFCAAMMEIALPDRPQRPPAGVSLAVVEPVAGCLPAAGGAAEWLLAVLSPANLKPGSGCPGPCGPSSAEGVEQPAEKQKDRQPGEESRHGDGPSLYNPMCIEKMGNIYETVASLPGADSGRMIGKNRENRHGTRSMPAELAPNSANGLIPSLIAWAKSQPPGNVAIVSIYYVILETIARLPGGLSEQIAIKGRNAW